MLENSLDLLLFRLEELIKLNRKMAHKRGDDILLETILAFSEYASPKERLLAEAIVNEWNSQAARWWWS